MSLQQFLTNFGDDDCRYFTRRCSAEASNSSIQIKLCGLFPKTIGRFSAFEKLVAYYPGKLSVCTEGPIVYPNQT